MTNDSPLKVLVVDDAILYRSIISDVLSGLPGVKVVGSAGNGRIAVQRIKTLKPDILTLDIEMPEMNGLDVLEWTRENAPDVGAIMFSSFTRKGGEMTVKALNLGAFDFIQKVQADSMEANKKALKEAIAPMLTAFARRREVRRMLKGIPASARRNAASRAAGDVRRPVRPAGPSPLRRAAVIGIGVSTGGPEALARMLPGIPGDIGVPILVVQHMPAAFTDSITSSLNEKCAIDVRAAVDGEPLAGSIAYFAPGGKQMKVDSGSDGKNMILRVTDDRPENSCRPSADYLFRSLAHHFGGRAAGVIMTGMGSDGTVGLKLMKRKGAHIIAQDEASCTVFGMPKEPIESGIADIISPLDGIAEEICRLVRGPIRYTRK